MQPLPHDPRRLAVLAGAASAALLAAALAFQAAGYAPCELCVLQRWPHVVAAVAGGIVLLTRWRAALAVVGLVGVLAAMALAAYHSGVEWGWWPGPAACTGGVQGMATMSAADLVAQLNTTAVVRCDQPALLIFGLSMAAWNAIASAALAVVWARSLSLGRRRLD